MKKAADVADEVAPYTQLDWEAETFERGLHHHRDHPGRRFVILLKVTGLPSRHVIPVVLNLGLGSASALSGHMPDRALERCPEDQMMPYTWAQECPGDIDDPRPYFSLRIKVLRKLDSNMFWYTCFRLVKPADSFTATLA
jgi:hypothetical protein